MCPSIRRREGRPERLFSLLVECHEAESVSRIFREDFDMATNFGVSLQKLGGSLLVGRIIRLHRRNVTERPEYLPKLDDEKILLFGHLT